MSVRNYAILWPDRKSVSASATAGGGNQLLTTGPHALDGAEHTGQLPDTRISTTEVDTTLVLHPDGLGGVAWDIDATGGAALPLFNVMDAAYGAIADGATDNLAAVNAAIAARNAAGGGVLYFPAGADAYLTSAGFDAITTPGLILGDGRFASIVECTSTTATLFTTTVDGCPIRDLGASRTGGTATAGAFLDTAGGLMVDVQDCNAFGFFHGIIVENMLGGIIRGNFIQNCRGYGIVGRNTAVPDAGDSTLAENLISTNFAGLSAIRWESSGGLRMVNNKVNGGGNGSRFVYGLDVEVTTGVNTSIGILMANSIENVGSHAIRLVATGSGGYGQWIINGVQVGLLNSNNAGRAIYASGAGITDLEIDNVIANTTGTARAAIELVNVVGYRVGRVRLLNNFTSIVTTSGASGGVDDTGSIAGVAITGTPTSGQIPIASSGTAAAWGTPSAGAPTTADYLVGTAQAGLSAEIVVGTSPGGELGGTWASPTVDTTHSGSSHADAIATAAAYTNAAIAAINVGQILIADSHSTPLVFGDLIQTEAEDDLVYSD